MELRHLRYFVAVAEELNFRRAAERLFMAQPPLSQQIRQLEEEIGTLLFERGPRRVTLTAAGVAFLEDARAVLADAESAVARARRIGRGEEGRLRVGFSSSAAYDLLPRAVRVFREQHPEVELVLTELLGPEQTKALRDRTIDVGLTIEPDSIKGIVVEEVARIPLVVALPAVHVLAGQAVVHLEELDGESFVRFPRSTKTGFARLVARLFEEAEVVPVEVQATEELQTALGLVAAGLGFTIAPGLVRSLAREGLVFRDLPESAPKMRLNATYREGESSALVPRFVALAQVAAAS